MYAQNQPKRSHRRKNDAPFGGQLFSISNGGAAVLHRDRLFMLCNDDETTLMGANEIQSESLTGFDEIVSDAPSFAQFFGVQSETLSDAWCSQFHFRGRGPPRLS